MTFDVTKLVCKHLLDLVPYQSARRIGGHGHVFLNANEAPKSQLYFFNSTTLNRYPDCQPEEVTQGYADYAGLRRDQVLVSRGSDEAIGLIIRAFCEPDEAVVIAPPTYGMYKIAALTNRVKVTEAVRDEGFLLTAANLTDAAKNSDRRVKAVFIDSPANPLGSIFPHNELEKLLKNLPDVLIVIDEAYIEFAPESTALKFLEKYPNLIILRTLSKAFALAGIRCGFALANPDIIRVLTKVIDPYPIPDPTAQTARQALAPGGIELMQERVLDLIKKREALAEYLKGLKGVREVFESHANFLLVRFNDGSKVFNTLSQKGIILRSFEDRIGLENCIRITIGTSEELDELMRVLTPLLDEA